VATVGRALSALWAGCRRVTRSMFVRRQLVNAIFVVVVTSLTLVTVPVAAATAPRRFWVVSSTGQVFARGKGTRTYGSLFGKRFRGRVVGIKATPDRRGYWIVTTRAHYSFGDARRFRYRRGGIERYRGKLKLRGLKGSLVGWAPALPPRRIVKPRHSGPSNGTTTTTAATTTTPAAPQPSDCSGVSMGVQSFPEIAPNQFYSQQLSAAGAPGGGTWSWRIVSGALPPGLWMNQNGLISGTAGQTAGNSYQFTAQAVNSLCPNNPATGNFTILGVPEVTTSSLPDATVGEPYSATVTATGGTGGYTFAATDLPAGLTMTPAGQITGTPTEANPKWPSLVDITATDSAGYTSPDALLELTVNYQPLEIASPTSLPAGQATVGYKAVQFTATGGMAAGDQSLYTWSATGLPAGMSMSYNGVLSGTPAAQGHYTVTVTLPDEPGGVGSTQQDFTLDVAYAPLAFTTSTLTVIQGESYTGQVVAHGGEAPYTMYRLSGALPSGLTFNNGTLSGTTTAAPGDYQITLGVTDSQSSPQTEQETFDLWVAPSEVVPDQTVTSTETSNNIWSGYVEQASSAFTSASGTFTVPTAASSSGAEAGVWVGIDGYSTDDLIQAGTASFSGDNGQPPTYEAWWETLGVTGSTQTVPPQNQFAVKPGDSINVNIWQISTGTWEITLNDTTSGQGFATQVSYSGTDETAEWITEGGTGNPPQFYEGSVTFSNLAASQAGSGMVGLAIDGSAGSSYPSALSNDSFSTSY